MSAEKKSNSKAFLVLFIISLIVIILMGVYIYLEKTNSNNLINNLKEESSELQSKIDNLQEKLNTISDTINSDVTSSTTNTSSDNCIINEEISYIEIQIDNSSESTQGLSYTDPLKIEKESVVSKLTSAINSAKLYDSFEEEYGVGGFFESCPIVTFYYAGGTKYTVTASDNWDNKTNIFMGWSKEDGSDKKIYKIDSALAQMIENIYTENK